MNKFLLLLLIPILVFGQTDTDTKVSFVLFKKELQNYMNKVDPNLPPALCGEYQIRHTIQVQGFDEILMPSRQRNLCDDIKRFEEQLKNPETSSEWTYDIRSIGDRFYIVRADKNFGGVLQEFYYYERIPEKNKRR